MPDTPSGDAVAHYYDSNTRRFLIVGGGAASHSIHRQLWGPGVGTTADAADYINRLIAERIGEIGSESGVTSPDSEVTTPDSEVTTLDTEVTILDMGCGVGGTLFHLAEVFPRSRLHGITISPEQRDIANRIAAKKGLQDRCRVHLGDFQSARLDVEADAIVAVESFVHAESPERFFTWAADHLRVGGRLMLADDFLRADVGSLDDTQRSRVADFQTGWRAPGLCTVDCCARAAAGLGLEPVSDADLTPLIRLGRPRDLVIAALSPVFRRLGLARLPFFGNMIGGNALQVGLREGLFTYRFLVFRKRGRSDVIE